MKVEYCVFVVKYYMEIAENGNFCNIVDWGCF